MPRCKSCPLEFEWHRLASGALVPVDPLPVERAPQAKDVLLLHDGRAFVVSMKNVGAAQRAIDAGAGVLRESHWETCLGAVNHRDGGIHPDQETLL